MDFDFVEVHRVKEFSFRPVSCTDSEDEELCTATHSTPREYNERTLNLREIKTKQQGHSVWNVDGEIIDEPAIHVRYYL